MININQIIELFRSLDNFQKLTLVLITILFINQLRMSSSVEKMTATDGTAIRQAVKDVYQADVQAIKNLGDLAKRIYDTNGGTLTIPANLEVTGNIYMTNKDKHLETYKIKFPSSQAAKGNFNAHNYATIEGDNGLKIRTINKVGSAYEQRVLIDKNGINVSGKVQAGDALLYTTGTDVVLTHTNRNSANLRALTIAKNGFTTLNGGYGNPVKITVKGSAGGDSAVTFSKNRVSTSNSNYTHGMDLGINGTGTFGVAKIGTGAGGGAEFTHTSGFGKPETYSFRSYGTGNTFINAPEGKRIYFRNKDRNAIQVGHTDTYLFNDSRLTEDGNYLYIQTNKAYGVKFSKKGSSDHQILVAKTSCVHKDERSKSGNCPSNYKAGY